MWNRQVQTKSNELSNGMNLLVLGSLIEMLRLHPFIVAPNYFSLENRFYSHDELYNKGEKYFINLMPDASREEKIITKCPGLIDPNEGLKVILQFTSHSLNNFNKYYRD